MELQDKGANNINLVTGVMYIPQIIEAIKLAKEKGIKTVCMAGGVSANSFLRKEFFARGEKMGLKTPTVVA